MATSKSSSFWLTEALVLDDSVIHQGSISLGAYLDVGDSQAVSIEEVRFTWMRLNTALGTFNYDLASAVTSNANMGAQLTSLNPENIIVRADDNTLVASGSLNLDDTNNITSDGPDLVPDVFGKSDESRFVVNDSLFFTAYNTGALGPDRAVVCIVHVKARIVRLSTKDWIAISITNTASDS